MSEAEQRTNELFVSYSRVNKVFVGQVIDALKQREVDPWFDADDIPKSAEWWREIQLGIINANAFAFIISAASLRSEVCNWELAYAIENGKKIIPVMYEDVFKDQQLMSEIDRMGWQNPAGQSVLAKENWANLQSLNFIFMTSNEMLESGVDEILQTARTDLDYLEQHTRFLRRATDWEQRGRANDYLLKDAEIKDAEEWLEKGQKREEAIPSELHHSYIEASRIAHTKRQRRLRLSVLAAFLVIIAVGLFAIQQGDLAEERDIQRATEQARADREEIISSSLDLAATAREILGNGDYILALSLAMAANTINEPPSEAQLTLADIAFSPGVMHSFDAEHGVFSSDEQSLVYTSGNKFILWDIWEHQNIYSVPLDDDVIHIDLLNDMIAVLLANGYVQILNLQDGEIIQEIDLGAIPYVEFYREGLNGVFFSPDGLYLLATVQLCKPGTDCHRDVFLLNLTTGNLVRLSYPQIITDLEWLPNGQNVVLGLGTAGISVWDIFNDQFVEYHSFAGGIDTEPPFDAGSFNTHIAINSEGTRVVSSVSMIPTAASGYIDPLQIWDIQQGTVIHRFDGGVADINDVEFAPNKDEVVSTSYEGLRLWNAITGDLTQSYLAESWSSLQFSGKGNFLLVASDEALQLWDFRSGTEIRSLDMGFNGTGTLIRALSVIDNNHVIIGGMGTVRSTPDAKVVDLTTGEILQSFGWHDVLKLSAGGNYAVEAGPEGLFLLDIFTGESTLLEGIRDAELSPDGNRILLISSTSAIVKETVSQRELFELGSYRSGQFLPDGRLVAYSDNQVDIFDDQGNVVSELRGYSLGEVSPDGRILFVLPSDCESVFSDLQFVEMDSGDVISEIRVSGCINKYSVAFSPNSKSLLVGGSDGTLSLWDISSGEEIRREYHPDEFSSGISVVEFLPDSNLVISASTGGIIRIWQMPTTLNDLKSWIQSNRVLTDLDCDELALYGAEAFCANTME